MYKTPGMRCRIRIFFVFLRIVNDKGKTRLYDEVECEYQQSRYVAECAW